VNAVGEEDDGLATLHAAEVLTYDEVNGVVESRAVARARASYGRAQHRAVTRRLGEYAHVVVKGDDDDAVVGAELIEEGDCSVLHLLHLEARRAGSVYDECDSEGLLDAARTHLREDQSVRGGAGGQKQGGGGELSHDFGSKTAENCPEARLNEALIACGVGEMSELYSRKVQSSKFMTAY